MAFDFPATPTLNQSVTTPAGSVFVWDGAKWTAATVGTGTVTSVIAGTGLTGGTITTTGTVALSTPVSVANGGTGATTGTAGPYLPLTGGVITGNLQANGNTMVTLSGPGGGAGKLFNNGAAAWVYRETTHYFQDQAGAGTFLSINASGMSLGGTFTSNGAMSIAGGITYTSTSGHAISFGWNGSALNYYVDGGLVGAVSDYRVKKDVVDLPSMWDRAKALRPVSYTLQDYTMPNAPAKDDGSPADPLVVGDDIERWGFIAHELQETLILDAATGVKDQQDLIQSLNPWTVIATLTRALQEAMARIEALEAA